MADDSGAWMIVAVVVLLAALFGAMYMDTTKETCIYYNGGVDNDGFCLPANTRAMSMTPNGAIIVALVFFILGEIILIRQARKDAGMGFWGFVFWNIPVIICAGVGSLVFNLVQIYLRTAFVGLFDWADTIDWARTFGFALMIGLILGAFWMLKLVLWNIFVLPAREKNNKKLGGKKK